MTKIGILADTHGWLDEQVLNHFSQCDEVWHAGDFGDIASCGTTSRKRNGFPHQSEKFSLQLIIKGVYGNIDGQDIRSVFPEKLHFECEECPGVHDPHRWTSGPDMRRDQE